MDDRETIRVPAEIVDSLDTFASLTEELSHSLRTVQLALLSPVVDALDRLCDEAVAFTGWED